MCKVWLNCICRTSHIGGVEAFEVVFEEGTSDL